MVIVCGIVALAAAGVYLAVAERTYVSATRLCIRQLPSSGAAEFRAGTVGNSANLLSTQCEIIRSTPVLQGALNSLDRGTAKSLFRASDPMVVLKARLTVEVGKRDDVITVRYEAPDAEESTAVVNAIVASYARWLDGQDRSALGRLRSRLADEKRMWSQQLEADRRAVAEFRRAHPSLILDADSTRTDSQKLSQMSSALTAAQLETISARAEQNVVRELASNPAGVAQLLASGPPRPELSEVSNELARLRGLLDEHEMRRQMNADKLGEAHPQFREAQRVSEQLREKIAAQSRVLLDAYAAAVERRVTAALAKEQEIQRVVDQERQRTVTPDDKMNEWSHLEAACKRTAAVCERLDARIHELGVGAGAEPSTIEILDPAKVPTQAVSPLKRRVLPLALAAGLVLGALAAVGLDSMDKRFRSSAHVVAATGLPVVGVIPRTGRKASLADVEAAASSELFEACRSVRSRMHRGPDDHPAQTVLVTSPDGHEGRTLLARNLAMAMARAGQRVLLIDADSRHPNLDEVFRIADVRGLAGLAAGVVKLTEAARPSGVANLDVLPAGPSTGTIADLLESGRLSALLDQLAEQYDQIVVDSSPVLRGMDAPTLSSLCDATVLVVRADRSRRAALQLAIEALLNQGANLIGIVVNASPSRQTGIESAWHCRYCAGDAGTQGGVSDHTGDVPVRQVVPRSAA